MKSVLLPILFGISTKLLVASSTTPPLDYNQTFHVFLLMVPESDLHRLHRNYHQYHHLQRQEEVEEAAAGALSFAQTSQIIGQIIQGALGGDVRPIFAGSVMFIDDMVVQQGIGGFLRVLGPGVNLALREFYTRAQVALGFATTPGPVVQNATQVTGNGTMMTLRGNGTMAQPMMMAPPPPKPTTAWEYVVNQIYASTTPLMPLPLINPLGVDEDEDYKGDDSNKDAHKKVF